MGQDQEGVNEMLWGGRFEGRTHPDMFRRNDPRYKDAFGLLTL